MKVTADLGIHTVGCRNKDNLFGNWSTKKITINSPDTFEIRYNYGRSKWEELRKVTL
jgi:hypothetical protein